MVQPAICVHGKWQAVGKVSEKTHERVVAEVSRMWEERQKAIYRDSLAGVTELYPDFGAMLEIRARNLVGSIPYPGEDGEFLGERSEYYTTTQTTANPIDVKEGDEE
jgi:hypothetical protein